MFIFLYFLSPCRGQGIYILSLSLCSAPFCFCLGWGLLLKSLFSLGSWVGIYTWREEKRDWWWGSDLPINETREQKGNSTIMLFSAPKSPGLKPCDSLPSPKHATSRIPQGLGRSWPECWLPKRSSLFAFQSFVVNQSWLEVLESWLPLCTAVLYFFFITTIDSITREKGSLLFQIVSLNLKNQEISLQS